MKRLIAAAVLFVLAITVSVAGHTALTKTCDEIIGELSNLGEMAQSENFTQLKKESADFADEWDDRYHKILSVLVGHNRLDTIQKNIPLLEKSAELHDKAEFLYSCLECISMLDDLKLNEKVSISNILVINRYAASICAQENLSIRVAF